MTTTDLSLQYEEQARREELANTPEPLFKTWLKHTGAQFEEFNELREVILGEHFDSPRFIEFDYQLYAMHLLKLQREDLLAPLLHAEAGWNEEKAGIRAARTSLGLDRKTGPDLPLALVKCGWKDEDQIRCPNDAVPGAVRCLDHGGEWLDPRIRQSYLMSGYSRLVEGVEVAVDALIHVAMHGKREDARVMAAREILDRAGIRAGIDVNISVTTDGQSNEASELEKRLAKMSENLGAAQAVLERQAELDAAREAEIIDAEVISDSSAPEGSNGSEPG